MSRGSIRGHYYKALYSSPPPTVTIDYSRGRLSPTGDESPTEFVSPEADTGRLSVAPGYPSKLFVPVDDSPPAGWAMVLDPRSEAEGGPEESPIVFLSNKRYYVVDIDRTPPGGAPRGVLAQVRTRRGAQWVYLQTPKGRNAKVQDPWYEAYSDARGYFGQRVLSLPNEDGLQLQRELRPGPEVGLRGMVPDYEYLAEVWTAAGGYAAPYTTASERVMNPRRRLAL